MVDTQEWEKLWGREEDRRIETGRRRKNEGQGPRG